MLQALFAVQNPNFITENNALLLGGCLVTPSAKLRTYLCRPTCVWTWAGVGTGAASAVRGAGCGAWGSGRQELSLLSLEKQR